MAKDAFTKPKPLPGKVLERFGETTSAHGVPKIIGATSYLSSFLWTVVSLVALGLFCYQGGTLVVAYFNWPYTTKLDIVTRASLQFPAVTICNMNKLRRSQLVGTIYEGLLDLDGGPMDSEYSWWFDWPESFYEERLENAGSFRGALNFNESAVFPTDNNNSTSVNGSSATETVWTQAPSAQPDGEAYYGDSTSSTPLFPFRRKRSPDEKLTQETTRDDEETTRENVRIPREAPNYETIYERFSELGNWGSKDFEFYDYYNFDTVSGENDWAGFLHELLETGDFSRWLDIINPPKKEVERLGHQESEFITQCSFDKKSCSAKDFYKFQNNLYGNCYVFNHAVNMTTPRNTGKTGAQHGLHLTLFVEQPEYIGLLTQETGVRVSIHDPRSIPYPEDDGFTVPTGVSSSVGIRQSLIQRLQAPHGNCTSGANSNFSSNEFQYSRRACLKHCFQNHLEEKCGCVTDIGMDQPLCSVVNATQQVCRQFADTLFQEDLLECVCPTPCTQYGYRKTVSSSTWPSERFEPHLVDTLSSKNIKIGQILKDVTLTRKNLVQLKVYFEELNYEAIEQTPLYTIEGLLGGVGGLMGLYVGLSVITLFEIMVFLCRFLRASWDKMMDRDNVKPFSAKNDLQAVPDYDYGYKGTGLL